MSLNAKLNQSMSDSNVGDYLDLLHEDFIATFHKSGDTFSKTEWAPMVTGMMGNEKFIQESSRCIYENDDIIVEHFIAEFQDDTTEAVLSVHLINEGLLWRTETGSTPIEKGEPKDL